jgi:queuine tRNA-ribosyltransferase catalytic subunit
MLQLMKQVQAAILEDRYPEFVRAFFAKIYQRREDFPAWAVNAMSAVGVDL